MDSENKFTAIEEDGSVNEYKMLFCKTVDGKPIIWYTDETRDEQGRINIYISSYKEVDKKYVLDSIDNLEELNKYINIFKANN